MESFITVIYILLNLFALGLYGYDKFQAKRNGWRVPENTLLVTSILGGCFGGIAAMYLFHHKTRKQKFVLINAIACVLYAAVFLVLIF